MLLGVDVGGTFTDAVAFNGAELHTAKSPSTPDDVSRGVLAAVESVLERVGADAADVEVFAHGMTVGTNALLTESGARTALVATDGFTDVLEVARQNRPDLYRLCAPKPVALVPRDLRVGARERIGPKGEFDSLDEDEVERIVREVQDSGAESVALCLLFSYLDDRHERAIAERLRAELPDVHVSASHEVLPQFREYERASTTVVDAYLSPLLGRYLDRLSRSCDDLGLPAPMIMKPSGGVAPTAEPARAGAWSVLSGPAGGAVGAAVIAELSGGGDAVGIDMGGTSCDVCVVEGGRVRRTDSREIAGRVIQLPMVDVHTVGAGGGSIGWGGDGGGPPGGRPPPRRRGRLDRLAGPWRRPPGRPAVRRCRPRPCLLWPRRDGAHGHRCEPP